MRSSRRLSAWCNSYNVSGYLDRLQNSLRSWENKVSFEKKIRVSQTESGFPAFQNVLDLQNDRADAASRLDQFDDEETIRQNMVNHILSKKAFPAELQKSMAERRYLQAVQEGKHFLRWFCHELFVFL